MQEPEAQNEISYQEPMNNEAPELIEEPQVAVEQEVLAPSEIAQETQTTSEEVSEPVAETETVTEQAVEEQQPQVGEAPAPTPIQKVETQPKAEKPQDIATKIAGVVSQKQEYASPPDYSVLGRGLVYNCVGKHWACVDRQQYFECRDNMVWSEQNQKSPECVIRNVYANYEDCKTIQIHYINMAEPTDFCGE